MLEVPLLGQWMRQQSAVMNGRDQARRGVNVTEELVDNFVVPLIAPKVPARYAWQPPC